jgi:uncharacterized protein (TIGR03437 family)
MRRTHVLQTASCAILIGLSPLFGQGPTLAGIGYTDPSIIRVAPGQITTLFVTGLKTVLSSSPVNATTVPPPFTLSGISVTLNQTGGAPTPVPLLSIQQVSVCNGGNPQPADCLLTAITVQIPFELSFFPPPPPTPQTAPELVVSDNGNVSKAFRLSPFPDNLHVINVSDAFPSPRVKAPSSFWVPLVTHADGTIVTADNPAQPDEEVVIWAYGLGQVSPAVKTGQPSPSPAATVSSPLYLRFDFTSNAMPSPPFINRASATPAPAPIFAGLTPGQVGLYQINVTIPSTIPTVDKCGSTCSHVMCTIYNTVTSNLTIDIGANQSWDGAAICVQPGQ